MGKHFGNLQRLKGVIYFSLSPTEVNPFKGILNPGIVNNVKLFSAQLIPMIPGVILTWTLYNYINDLSRMSGRKNPADYKNDV